MVLSIPQPNTLVNHTSLQGGAYIVESLLEDDGNRVLLWATQPKIADSHLLIERIAPVGEDEARTLLAKVPHMQQLSHESLARCVDAFVENGAFYCVMATGAGTTLKQLGILPQRKVIQFGVEICNVLNYLGRLGDQAVITPSAVFITTHERARLISLTSLMSVANDRNVGDTIYNLGATLHAALTGWQGSYHDAVAPNAAELCPTCSPELAEVLAGALAPDPTDRWPTIAEFRFALLQLS